MDEPQETDAQLTPEIVEMWGKFVAEIGDATPFTVAATIDEALDIQRRVLNYVNAQEFRGWPPRTVTLVSSWADGKLTLRPVPCLASAVVLNEELCPTEYRLRDSADFSFLNPL